MPVSSSLSHPWPGCSSAGAGGRPVPGMPRPGPRLDLSLLTEQTSLWPLGFVQGVSRTVPHDAVCGKNKSKAERRGLIQQECWGLCLLPEHLWDLICLSWHLVSLVPGFVHPRQASMKGLLSPVVLCAFESLMRLPHSLLPETLSHLTGGETQALVFSKISPGDTEVQLG